MDPVDCANRGAQTKRRSSKPQTNFDFELISPFPFSARSSRSECAAPACRGLFLFNPVTFPSSPPRLAVPDQRRLSLAKSQLAVEHRIESVQSVLPSC